MIDYFSYLFLQPNASSPSKTGTLQTRSVTASQLATDSPAKMNGHYHDSPGKIKNDVMRFTINYFIIHRNGESNQRHRLRE